MDALQERDLKSWRRTNSKVNYNNPPEWWNNISFWWAQWTECDQNWKFPLGPESERHISSDWAVQTSFTGLSDQYNCSTKPVSERPTQDPRLLLVGTDLRTCLNGPWPMELILWIRALNAVGWDAAYPGVTLPFSQVILKLLSVVQQTRFQEGLTAAHSLARGKI